MEVSIATFKVHVTRLHGGNYTEDGNKKPIRKPFLFNNVEQTARLLLFLPRIGCFAHFLTTRLHGGTHPDDGSNFRAEKRSFTII